MSLFCYKRPNYVARGAGPMDASDHQKYPEKSRRSIPNELCFEYVVSNRAMPVRYVSDTDKNTFANAILAVLPVRFHGLPTVRLARGQESTILALVA